MGSLELYDHNTCYMTDDGCQVMAKANAVANPNLSFGTFIDSLELYDRNPNIGLGKNKT